MMLRSSHRLSLISLALLALVACAHRPGINPPPGDPNLLFRDDFSQLTSGWDRHTAAEATTDYDAGQYLIAVQDTGVDVWASPGLDFTDATLEADAARFAGPTNNEFGLICRYKRDGDKSSFYFFLISSDGYAAVGKVSKNKRTYLNSTGNFEASSAIKTGDAASNHLAATCNGKSMSFSVNGTLVGKFEDTEFTHGDVGLIAGTFDEGGVKIHFDNFSARKP